MASAAGTPMASTMSVTMLAVIRDVLSPAMKTVSCGSSWYHRNEKPCGGKDRNGLELKEMMSTTSNGANRKTYSRATSATNVGRPKPTRRLN
jgi:hypothetical protein